MNLLSSEPQMKGKLPGIIELGVSPFCNGCDLFQSLFFVRGNRRVWLCLQKWEGAFVSSAWIPASSGIQSSGSMGSKMFILGNPTSKKLCMAPASHLFREKLYGCSALCIYSMHKSRK